MNQGVLVGHLFGKMSIVTVQLGQCGNQVGQELFDVICKDARGGQKRGYTDASTARFFHETTTGGRTAVSAVLMR